MKNSKKKLNCSNKLSKNSINLTELNLKIYLKNIVSKKTKNKRIK